jgi:hypothetical protein
VREEPALDHVLHRVDLDPARFTADEAARLPRDAWRSILASGLVRPAGTAETAECDWCAGAHAEDVEYEAESPGEPPRPYITCPEFGSVDVEPERLLQWDVDAVRFAEALAAALACAGRVEEIVPGRLWLLGRIDVRGRAREAFFARRLAWPRDAKETVGACPRLLAAVAPVVLVAENVPAPEFWRATAPRVLTVAALATIADGRLVVDRAYLAGACGDDAAASGEDVVATPPFPTPRGASWSDVDIRVRDGESVSVRVRDERRVVTFVEMGMADGRTKLPDKQWRLLEAYAARGGALTWERNADVGRRNKKRTERLAAALRAYFGIPGDPIEYVEATKGWRTRFALRLQ